MTDADRATFEREIAERDARIDALQRALGEERQDKEYWRLRAEELMRRYFGRSSEHQPRGQLDFLGETVEAPAPDEAPDDEATEEAPAAKRRKGAHGRKPLPKDLPRQRVVQEVAEADRKCGCCGETMQRFGEDVTEELDYEPAKLFVREHVRPKYACKACQEGVAQADLPARPVEKGRPGAGLLAHVLVSKYVDHLPLARQSRIFLRHGIEIPRSTLCDWVGVCVHELDAIILELKREALSSGLVQADETPITVLEEHDGRRRRQCWLWVYRGKGGETVFDFRETRARDGPADFLRGYRGYLQRDGYQGYDGLPPEIVGVGCWAHARRHFFDALPSDEARATEAIALIAKLYAVEREARDLAPAERAALRGAKVAPVLREIRARLDAWAPQALPRSPFGQAVGYALGQWPTLVRYLEDGRIEIDNNAVENAVRPVALGRKNWLFAGSYEGGRRAAVLYSLIASCKAAGADPYAYFADVLGRTATAPARILTPRAWKAARESAAAAGVCQ